MDDDHSMPSGQQQTPAMRRPVPAVRSDDLPLWMRQARQRVDWGVVLVLVLCLVAGWPFALRDGLPRTNAAENAVYAAADTAQALSEGRLYPRWSAAVQGGYGAPVPHYYPPGAAYSAAVISVMFTNDPVVAVRVLFIAGLALAGAMTYVFVLRRAGAAAGILAALLYVYSPYVGLTAPYLLGDLAGVLGLALLPAVLWSASRLMLVNRPLDFALVAFIGAALLLTDVRLALVGFGLALLLIGWDGRVQRAVVWQALIALCAGVLLAAFFWLPALLERDAVHWIEAPFQPVTGALDWRAVLRPVQAVDLGQIVTLPQFTLGLPLVVFAGLAQVAGLHLRRGLAARWHLPLACLAAGAGLLLLALVVFPGETWLLGPVSLCGAVGGSAALAWAEHPRLRRWRRLLPPLALIAALALAFPGWLPPLWGEHFGEAAAADQIVYEQQGFGYAVLPPGARLPSTLPEPATLDPSLAADYRSDGVPVRIPRSTLSIERQASLLSAETHRDRYLIQTTQPVTFDVLRAYFPGWRATLNGEPVRIGASAAGLIQVEIPAAADGELIISLGPTPVRRAAWLISGLALLLVVSVTVRRLRRDQYLFYDELALVSPPDARLLMLVTVGFVGCVLLFARPESPYSLHARPGYALDDSTALHMRSGAGLEALAYHLDRTTYRRGQTLDFSIAWRLSRVLVQNYRVRVALYDLDQGLLWARQAPVTPGGYPTRRWTPNGYILDPYRIELPPVLRPGQYQIAVQVIDCAPLCPEEGGLGFYDERGEPVGSLLLLPPVIDIKP